MKLILCEACFDVVALSHRSRVCDCAKSAGKYNDDGDTITVSGPCRVYGVDNRLFYTGRAEAFKYPENNGKVTRA